MVNLARRNIKRFGVASSKKGQKLGGANGPTGIQAQWGEILSEGAFYSVSHIITYPSKELCSKMALGEGGVSLP